MPPDGLTDLIPVTEQSSIYGLANFSYRGLYDPNAHAFADNKATSIQWRASVAYVSGAHNFKIGYMGSSLSADVRARRQRFPVAIHVQQQESHQLWLRPRPTVGHDRPHDDGRSLRPGSMDAGQADAAGAIRYDRAWSWAPAEGNGTTETSSFNPQPITFERTVSVKGYNDITPRIGRRVRCVRQRQDGAQGQSREALKSAEVGGVYAANNPAVKTVTRVTARPWTDGNRNFRIDCDLSNPGLQDNLASGGDRCAALGGNDLNFGNPNPT